MDCELIYVEGLMEFENHCFATAIELIDSGRNDHWMLQPARERLVRTRIVIWCQNIDPQAAFSYNACSEATV